MLIVVLNIGSGFDGEQIKKIGRDDVDAWTHFNVDLPIMVDGERTRSGSPWAPTFSFDNWEINYNLETY